MLDPAGSRRRRSRGSAPVCIPERPSACKITQKGANDARHVRVHGIAVLEMRISYPATTRLQQGTWDQNYVHAGSNKPATTTKKGVPSDEPAPAEL